jgi:hypothetical protein
MPTQLPSDILEADRASLVALKDLRDYTAINPLYSTEALTALAEEMDQAEEAMLRAQKVLAAARDKKIAITRQFHSGMIGARTNVTVQYGPDSPEVQAIGLKKKSEYKRPARRQLKQPAL